VGVTIGLESANRTDQLGKHARDACGCDDIGSDQRDVTWKDTPHEHRGEGRSLRYRGRRPARLSHIGENDRGTSLGHLIPALFEAIATIDYAARSPSNPSLRRALHPACPKRSGVWRNLWEDGLTATPRRESWRQGLAAPTTGRDDSLRFSCG